MVFSLLISTHVILSISESTVLKFNYSDSFTRTTTLIYKYSVQWVWVERWHQTYNLRNMFDSYAYSFGFINLEKYLYSVFINNSEWLKSFINIYSLLVFSFLQRKCCPHTRCIKKIANQPCYNVIFLFVKNRTQMLKKSMACVYHLFKSVARSLLFRLRILSAFNTVVTLNPNFLYYWPCSFNNVMFP